MEVKSGKELEEALQIEKGKRVNTNTADDDRWRWTDVKQKRASGEVSKPRVDETSGVGRHARHHLDQGSPHVEGRYTQQETSHNEWTSGGFSTRVQEAAA